MTCENILDYYADLTSLPDLHNSFQNTVKQGINDMPYYLHSDRLGSATAVTNQNGATEQILCFQPFGEDFLDLHNAYETPYQVFGYEADAESSLNYANARYYMGKIGKQTFNSTDPMWYKYPHLTPYHYCSNNPIMFVDPTGMKLDVTDDTQSRTDVENMVKSDNQKYIKYNGNELTLDFGDMEKADIDKLLKNDKGLSTLNDLSSAKENYLYSATHDHAQYIEWRYPAGEWNQLLPGDVNTNGLVGTMVTGEDANVYIWFNNTSTTPRGDEGGRFEFRPKQSLGYDGIVTISPGNVLGESLRNKPNQLFRSSYVRHELQESFNRTTGKMSYDKAHNAAGRPFTFYGFFFTK